MLYRITLWGASLALALSGCAVNGPAPSAADAAAPLAAGWQEHSRPLVNFGPGRHPGTTVWYVPTLLPPGTYELISREGDGVRLVDGHRFSVDGNPAKDVRLILPFGYSDVEAVDARYVVAPPASAAP